MAKGGRWGLSSLAVQSGLGATAAAALTIFAVSAAGQAAPAAAADAMDKQFVCPEAMKNDAQRSTSLDAFMQAFGRAHPDATVADMLLFRREMLNKHKCTRTLQNLQAEQDAVELGEVDAQAWLPLGSTSRGITLSVSMDQLKPFVDPRFPTEKAVEDYSLVAFNQPRKTTTHVEFDRVVSHEVYYCSRNQYAVVGNQYFLADKSVLTDSGPVAEVDGAQVYQTVNIPNGSLTQAIARWACGAAKPNLS
jgi:hypothetical protein